MTARLGYVELPVPDVRAAAAFYSAAFGWTLSEFGPSYAATTTGDVDIGLQGDAAEASTGPLAVITVDDLAAAEAAVISAGGRITRAAFGFPGGSRFHFRDPSGNELAAMQPE